MSLSIGFRTDIGRKRNTNQDSFAVLRRQELAGRLDALVVVADGMGGARGGEVASSIVAQTVPDAVHDIFSGRNGAGTVDTEALLRDTIVRANGNVWKQQIEKPELRGMGTTCVAVIVNAGALTVANVGDSRVYLLRDGRLSQITEDHSEVWQQVKAGAMTREEANHSRFRNRITRAIGILPDVLPDVATLALATGDTVLLCSDGLTTEVEDAEIARILAAAPDVQQACDRLVATALAHGGSDNVTVVVLRYGDFMPLLDAGDEADTLDPAVDWRKALRSRSNEEEADFDAEPEIRPVSAFPQAAERRKERGRGGSVLARLLLLLVTLIAVGEGAALYLLWFHRIGPKPPPVPPVQAKADTRLDTLMYDTKTTTVLSQPLQDSYLLIDTDGNLIVVAADGGKLRVTLTPSRQVTHIPGFALAPLADASTASVNAIAIGSESQSRRRRSGATAPSSLLPHPLPVYLALDARGNLYQTDPATRSIAKYSPGGTRTISGIGRGALKAPAALAVDRAGNIYVIDNHQLKKIEAHIPSASIP